jgi:SAM-dependent methyltransferase
MKPDHLTWLKYIELGIGRRLTSLGHRWDVNWLIYNPVQFRYYHQLAIRNAPGVIDTLIQVFPTALRYADIGAGSGAYAAEARRRGREVLAFEHSPIGRLFARMQGVDSRRIDFGSRQHPSSFASLRFDLAYCLEVAEHLPATMGDELVRVTALMAPVVVFTAAAPGQGGTGHVNEQPKEYWIERFRRHRMRFDNELTRRVSQGFDSGIDDARWLVTNVLVFLNDCDHPRSIATN